MNVSNIKFIITKLSLLTKYGILKHVIFHASLLFNIHNAVIRNKSIKNVKLDIIIFYVKSIKNQKFIYI